ncbi:tetratricopeptide repeat protein [Gallaecimonas mangrovi]|uniref:tetratricopeptide repeat protein n=1 Tax=Gallaecimonas mangrovi TaxID=2291597 RepID=UPI001867975F|nr:tetratricopeptide repeat protein [Gallaecimonas mangrovi]
MALPEQSQQALDLANQALDDPKEGSVHFQALLLKGWVQFMAHNNPNDLNSTLAKLKAQAGEGIDPLIKADYAFLRASVAQRLSSNLTKALPLLEEAMSYCRPFNQMTAYRYCAQITAFAANSYALNGDLDRAQSLISEAYRFAKLGGDSNTFLVVKSLESALARRQGHTAQALTLLKEVELEAEQTHNALQQATAMSRQGMIYKDLGQYQQAKQQLMNALSIFQQSNDQIGTAETYRYLGEMMLAENQPKMAIMQFYNALDLLNQLKNDLYASHLMTDIGKTYRIMGEYKKARTFLDQALLLMRSHNLSLYEPQAHYQLALLYRQQHQLDNTVSELKKAIAGAKDNPVIEYDLRKEIMDTLVSVYREKGMYKEALSVSIERQALPKEHVQPQSVTVKVIAPVPTTPTKTLGVSLYWLLLSVPLALLLGASMAWLWLLRIRRKQRKNRLSQAFLHPATGFFNLQGYLSEGEYLLAELRRAMEVTTVGQNQPVHQPLAAMLCSMPGMGLAYETYGFEATRDELRRFADRLKKALPEARMMVQPSRDYLLFILPSPASGKEMQLTERLRQHIHAAAQGTFLSMHQLNIASTLLPLLPYHPRVGSAMTIFEALLLLQSLGSIELPHYDLWLLGQSCTLPSALSEPLRSRLGEAMQNGTIKVVGLSYAELTQRLQLLSARQQLMKGNSPSSAEDRAFI